MRRTGSLLPLALLAGCVAHPGPNGIVMPPPRPSETIAPASGPAQQLIAGETPVDAWWHGFGNAQLDALVERALAHNNDIAAAEANLRQAEELTRATRSAQGLQIDASYQAQRLQVSRVFSNILTDPNAYRYTLHTAQLTVAYPLDLFGAGRNRVRSARAAAEVAAQRLRAARATVVANLVLAVIERASLDAQIAATRTAIASNRELVTLLQRRRAIGDVGEADVAAQQTVLATVEAALPPLERQLQHQIGLINLLIGRAPGEPAPALPALGELQLPREVPVSLPAAIVAHRPDVRAAEAQVRGAAADLGAAIAARLPSIVLTGNAGGTATSFADVLSGPNLFYTLAGTITAPLFHMGQLRHQQRAAEAALAAAQAQYRAAALLAFLDVDDAIAALKTDAAALDAATRADSAASRTLTLTRRQVELGALGTLALLNASSAASQASVQRIQAEAARLSDSVALFQACGTSDNQQPAKRPLAPRTDPAP